MTACILLKEVYSRNYGYKKTADAEGQEALVVDLPDPSSFNTLFKRDVLLIVAVLVLLVLLSALLVVHEAFVTIKSSRIEAANLGVVRCSELQRIFGQTFLLNETVTALLLLDSDTELDFESIARRIMQCTG